MERVKRKRTARNQFVGAHVTTEVKKAIVKLAEEKDTTISRIVSKILTEVFKDESVQASDTRCETTSQVG